MKKFRVEAFLQEFPVIGELLEKKGIDPFSLYYIRVKRADANLLCKIHHIEERTGSVVGIYRGEEAFAYLPSVGWVGAESEYDFASNYAYTDPRHEEGQSLLEVLADYEEEPTLFAVVEYGIETVNHYSEGEGLTIFKPPKGVRVADLITEAREKALASVRAEAEF